MRELIIYGAGGFGRETALMVNQINSVSPVWKVIGFCDDNVAKGTIVDGLAVVGGMSYLNGYSSAVSLVIAVADPGVREQLRKQIVNPNVIFPVLIHPSVNLGDAGRNHIGEGSIITAGNIFTTNINLGRFVIVNLACTIGHDVAIGDFCSVMPGCSISGSVTLAPSALIGSGARILPGLRVGRNSRVGAGAVVTHDVADATTVIGVPARPMKV